MTCRHRRPDRARTLAGGLLIAASALLVAAPAARAQTWAEAGDAGSLVSTAQVTTGTGGLSVITGTLSQHSDVDVYCVQLTAVPPAGLPIVSLNPCTMMSDPSVYLFSASGIGINANMTCAGGMKEVTTPNVSLTPGLYYVAVAHYDWMPGSVGGDIWQPAFTGPLLPNGTGAGSALDHWTGPMTFVPATNYTLTPHPGFIGFCELATAEEMLSWGALKATYGD